MLAMVSAGYAKIWGQRCSTHAFSLLIGSVMSIFVSEVKICHRLIKFLVNHDRLYHTYAEKFGKYLVEVADTRFASMVCVLCVMVVI